MAGTDTLAADGKGREFVPWPDWKIGDIPSLARYVSVPALDETSLPVPDRYTDADPAWEKGRDIARSIYESILGLGLKYMHEPWRVKSFGYQEFQPRQRVRYPAWVWRDSGGTCLDLAILYATALMRAQIRPYIAILYPAELADPVRGEFEGHAFVIADLRAPLTDQHWEPAAPGPMERSASETGEEGSLAIRAGQDLPPYLLAVDPTRATTNFPLGGGSTGAKAEGFAPAKAAAARYLAGTDVRLCDVATAQLMGHPALPRPADSKTPAIWTRLPEMPEVTDYPSRMPVHERLAQARGRIVIYGPQGFGKSTLAYIRARSADGGYGWFLNATDRSTLQSQLAQAENDQQARGYKQPLERPDQVPFSELAVRRLEVSDAPWVLVLDNANGKPGDITPILPRDIGPNQTIIVTTTNADWLEEWPESEPGRPATHIVLEALDRKDMPGIDEGLRGLVGGSPLFYEAARSAIQSGAHVPRAPENAAGLVWQLAQDYLAGHPGALDLAHLIAWAPPVVLPVADFAGLVPHAGAPDGLANLGRSLEKAGLVRLLTQPARSVLMHRLIAARIRDDERLIQVPGHQPVPAPVALLATDAGQDLMTRLGDAESFTRLEAELGRERDPRIPARTWGLAVYGVARAGEIRGRSAPSSSLFEKAIGFLDQELDQSLLSECWNGRARYLKDHPPADAEERVRALDAALSWALTARELATRAAGDATAGSQQQLRDLIRAERAHAMQALIMRKQADGIADRAAKKARLAEAMAMLEESEANRGKYLAELGIPDSPDVDRARFNLGGSGIGLAKLSRGAEAERYLRAARRAYAEARRIRVQRYGEGIALPAIAACDNGIALAYYYGALLGADPLRDEREAYSLISPQSRMFLLRQATAACAEAFRARSLLAPADLDDQDATKSADLTIKISQVRKLVSTFHARDRRPLNRAEAERILGKVGTEAVNEAQDLGGIIDATDGDGE
ncbi:MAG TPA: hypothetical protein VGF54_18235 [Streptosporangiaceae bacterium]